MTESNFRKELRDAVAVRKAGYAKMMEQLVAYRGFAEPLSLDEPLSANKSVSVTTAFWLDAKWEQHKKVLDAFERFDLDPTNPWHWRLLIEAFVEVGLKEPGPKTKTVGNKYSELPMHIQQLKHQYPNLRSYTAIARRLISDKRFKRKYADVKLRTLRNHVSAMDWGSIEDTLREIRESIKDRFESDKGDA